MDGVAERLANSGVLRSKLLIQYLTGLTICLVAPFKAVFMNRLTEFTYADATGDVTLSSMSSSEVLVKIKEISTAAKAIYDHLHLGNKWNLPGKPGLNANATFTKCDNCGALGNFSNTFPKPCDEKKCKKACNARALAKKDAEGGRGGRGGRGGHGGRRTGHGEGQRAPWNDNSSKKGAISGVMNINGIWKMTCAKCGWNETHSTKYHGKQQRNAASFKLPPHHPYWLCLGKIYQTAAAIGAIAALPGAGAASTGGSGGSILGILTGVIDRAMTSTKRSQMSSFLVEMCNALGN